MPTMRGIIIIVQESRFQMIDDAGVCHLFTLSPSSAAEAQQLVTLQRDQTRIRVQWTEAPNAIGNIAHKIALPTNARAR